MHELKNIHLIKQLLYTIVICLIIILIGLLTSCVEAKGGTQRISSPSNYSLKIERNFDTVSVNGTKHLIVVYESDFGSGVALSAIDMGEIR